MKAATKSYKSLNTFKQYYTLQSTDYWHIKYPLNSDPQNYYWDMSEKAIQCELERDNEGLTQYVGEDGGTYYSSIELIQYAMASFQAHIKTKEKYWLNECILHTNKYLSLATQYKNATFTVLNKYPVALYGLKNEWPSALSLGVALSLLTRLYTLSEEDSYLDAAIKLFANFKLTVEEGGVLRNVKINDTGCKVSVLEEYPSEELSGVLNGHITALWGLYDLGKHYEESNRLFNELSSQLADNISLWDEKKWSNYDITYLTGKKKNLASIHYHMLHVQQLFVMFQLTGDQRFSASVENMIRQKYSLFCRVYGLVNKLVFRLF
ncbi:D-glucuronyl C5-epimerase family protein [Carboxylicivirga sp. M1479]|uniref:D-glucuronyl C5-epimerase family protein n=1 Tax=Carboxylicivirga sp. M1479 TaxID=2594476 RepID=UPI00117735CC|nr:D-glucuronyl C5-epimerase family protein [Carboxylicivirga sp. M1479]TRX72003.1 hypothetical protein FNN09_03080 [Carboxylicivirga sp. M1479]